MANVTATKHKTPSDFRRMARRAYLREAIPAVPKSGKPR